MKTLIIYDDNGVIYTQITGSYVKPEGLRHLEVEIPKGKMLIGVNVETDEAIFEDLPKLSTDLLQTQLEKQNRDIMDLTNLVMSLTETI